MKYAITATVHVGDLYKSLPSNARKANIEDQIKAMINAEFERQGFWISPAYIQRPRITLKKKRLERSMLSPSSRGLVDAK